MVAAKIRFFVKAIIHQPIRKSYFIGEVEKIEMCRPLGQNIFKSRSDIEPVNCQIFKQIGG